MGGVEIQAAVQFWKTYVFSQAASPPEQQYLQMWNFTRFFTLYVTERKKEHFREKCKSVAWKPIGCSSANGFIWSFLMEADNTQDSLHFPAVPL